MNIIYTDYAEDSILDRNIDKDIIKDTLLNPDEIIEGKKNRKIAHKMMGEKLLRVIFETSQKAYIVITAYYAEPKRYFGKDENQL